MKHYFLKYTIVLVIIFLSGEVSAQNSSFGVGVSALNIESVSGLYFIGNLRSQFSDRFGWQTEVGYASLSEPSGIVNGDKAMTLKTSLTAKIFNLGGITAETIIGVGGYKNKRDLFGLISGELFLSTQIGKNLVAGIPISYNFITWERQDYLTTGISLRFHM